MISFPHYPLKTPDTRERPMDGGTVLGNYNDGATGVNALAFSGMTLGKNPIFPNLKIKIQSFPSVENELNQVLIRFPVRAYL